MKRQGNCKGGINKLNIEFLLKMNEYAYDSVRNKYCLGMTEKDIEQIIVSSYRKMAGIFRFAETL